MKIGDFGSALTVQSAMESTIAGSTTKGVVEYTRCYAAPGWKKIERLLVDFIFRNLRQRKSRKIAPIGRLGIRAHFAGSNFIFNYRLLILLF